MAEIAAVRNVRLLDREPGKREVAGYVIESGIPIPKKDTKPARLLQALLTLKVGESFVHRVRASSQSLAQGGKQAGRKFTQRRVGTGPQYRIWRTA